MCAIRIVPIEKPNGKIPIGRDNKITLKKTSLNDDYPNIAQILWKLGHARHYFSKYDVQLPEEELHLHKMHSMNGRKNEHQSRTQWRKISVGVREGEAKPSERKLEWSKRNVPTLSRQWIRMVLLS
ncbi:hypothetical protein NPIL_559141 [Nephila pilipes]|uniref:Uncharacterized protein n=1 Tax=Nephila pilipes TaxID=299642 RepID=A0A8X6N7R5_NEPPI|nr:hypothetical protein NPIL_559141 [Nephila pilipes]